jgi:hypothetical protein
MRHRSRHRLAATAAIPHAAAIVAANQLTSRYGLIPVGFGLTATAGTYCAGCALIKSSVAYCRGHGLGQARRDYALSVSAIRTMVCHVASLARTRILAMRWAVSRSVGDIAWPVRLWKRIEGVPVSTGRMARSSSGCQLAEFAGALAMKMPGEAGIPGWSGLRPARYPADATMRASTRPPCSLRSPRTSVCAVMCLGACDLWRLPPRVHSRLIMDLEHIDQC